MSISRPTIKSITIAFEDHAPVVIDPTQQIALFWGDEGVAMLVSFYELSGQPEKAKKVREMWDPTTGVKEGGTGPAVIAKDPTCLPTGFP